MNLTEKVFETITELRNVDCRLVENKTYDSYQAYIEGYFIGGLNEAVVRDPESSEYSLGGKITRYYDRVMEHELTSNVYWTTRIRYDNKNNHAIEEKDLIEILINTTEGFFLANPDWADDIDKQKAFEKLNALLKYIKTRRGMFVQERLSLTFFLEGYIDGFSVYFNIDIREQICEWFSKKANLPKSFHWATQISDYYQGKTENVDTKLIETLEEFFNENMTSIERSWGC